MAVLRYLAVELSLNVDNFLSNVKAAEKEAKELEKAIRPTKDLFKEVGEAATGFGLAIVGAMAFAVKSTADYGDELNDLSKKTGVAVEELSRLKLAADTSGTDMEGLSTGLKFLAKNMELAITGSEKQQAAFKAVGITTKDLVAANGNVDVVLKKVADAFKNTDDDAAKTAVSLALFGKQGSELIPLLDEGSDGLKKWGDEAERTGRVMSKEAAAAADEFNDRLTVLKSSVAGLGGAIGTALLPTMKELVEKATDVIVEFREWAQVHPELIKLTGGLGVALTGTGGVLLGMAGLATVIPKVIEGYALLTKAMEGATIASVATSGALVGVLAAVVVFRKEIQEFVAALLSGLASGFESFVNLISRAVDKLGTLGKVFQPILAPLKELGFLAGGFSKALDENATALWKEQTLVDLTGKKLKEEMAARAGSTAGVIKHRIELEGNSKALEDQTRNLAFWTKALEEFRLKSSEGGDDVKNGLREADRQAKEIIADFKEMIQLEQSVGDFWQQQLNTFRLGAQSVKDDVKAGEEAAKIAADKIIKDHKQIIEEIVRKDKQAVEDVKRSAGKIFDDMFISGQSVFSSLKNLLKGGALSIGRTIFEDVVGYLGGPIKKAFDDFFTSLIESAGLKKLLESIGNRIGGALGGMLGGNNGVIQNATQVGTTAAQTATQAAASTASTGANSAAQAAGTGVMGTLNTVFSGVSAVASIGGIFQQKRLEGTMNAVEYNTRALNINFFQTEQEILKPIMFNVFNMKDLLVEIAQDAGAIYDGIAKLFDWITTHSGIAGPGVAAAGAGPNITLHINAPLTDTQMTNEFTVAVDRRTVRDEISPELLAFWKTGQDNALQTLIAMIKQSMSGSVSSRA